MNLSGSLSLHTDKIYGYGVWIFLWVKNWEIIMAMVKMLKIIKSQRFEYVDICWIICQDDIYLLYR